MIDKRSIKKYQFQYIREEDGFEYFEYLSQRAVM